MAKFLCVVFLVLSHCLAPQTVSAADDLIHLDTRPNIQVPIYYMKRDGARATVVLFPGGIGGIGAIVDGKPEPQGFFGRARGYFADSGQNVALVGRPSDMDELGFADRISGKHLADLEKVVDYVRSDSGLPVWVVGTSRGTISATAAAIAFGNEKLAGIILTSSVTDHKRIGAVATQNLASIRRPVLVVHHEKDACPTCNPSGVPEIISGLKHAPVKKLVMVNNGGDPSGDYCRGLHYHSYYQAEKEVVEIIANWIRSPTM